MLAIGSVHSQTSRTKSQFYMKHWRGRAICVAFFLSSICELASIENYWGFAKQCTRSRCDYSIQASRKTVPLSLDAVPLSSIRNYFRRAHHLMQAYDQGLSYKLAMFAHKKYKSHRRLPPNQMDAIDDEINARHTSEEQV